MLRRSRVSLLAVILLLGAAVLFRGPVTPRAADPAKLPRINAANVVELRQHVGKQVTVAGRVVRTAVSKSSGHQFLNFANTELSAICFSQDLAKFANGKPVNLYQGKEVELTGLLELYRNKLQIRIRGPAQIRIVVEPTTESKKTPSKTVKLKQIGSDAWMSPAGLVYRGRDPEGRTRVNHVLRHAQDSPSREGPHGVFDGGKDAVFGLIDEAWLDCQRQGIRPQAERDRVSYLIPMGRRVGYLGGRLGASRGKPALSRVFIVLETGTKNVVTAFPK